MYTVDEILQRLVNGEDSSTIAAEMAGLLNDAIAEKENLDKEIAETARRKQDLAQDIASRINDFLKEFYPKTYANILPDDIIAIGEGSPWLTELFDAENIDKKSPDKIIEDFLKKLDL